MNLICRLIGHDRIAAYDEEDRMVYVVCARCLTVLEEVHGG